MMEMLKTTNSQEIAKQYSSLLLCMILEEDEDSEVQQVAIHGMTDILIVYGDLQRNDLEDDQLGVGVVDVVESLNHYVFHTNETLQFAGCNALCRLFVFDKIHSLLHLSNLILLYKSKHHYHFIDCLILPLFIELSFDRCWQYSSLRLQIHKSTRIVFSLVKEWSIQ